MTAVYITAIIAATLLINSAIIAARDVAKAKHEVAARNCTHDTSKETEA